MNTLSALLRFLKATFVFGGCLLLFPMLVTAAEVSLAWDAPTPAPEGYYLYQRQLSNNYNYSHPVWCGNNTHCTITVNDGEQCYFVVRAFRGNQQSADSNQIYFIALEVESDDGTPDSGEIESGSDPIVDDADSNLDNGGIEDNADGDSQGNDHTQPHSNTAPDKPELRLPADDAEVGLSPVLVTGRFRDVDGDRHQQTRYQISTTELFDALVLDNTSSVSLTRLTVMDQILDPETTYYWRVQFIDQYGGTSVWSGVRRFRTIDAAAAGYTHGHCIPDDQTVDSYVDLDRDGTDDRSQAEMVCIQTDDPYNPVMAIRQNSDGVRIGSVRSYDSQEPHLAPGQPQMISGLLGFKLYLDEDVTTASIEIYFTEPAPVGAQWYKYDSEEGWSRYPNAVFSADRRYVTLFLEDGGSGDQDGVVNGIIVDPSGLALGDNSDNGTAAVGGGGEAGGAGAAGGGCFIQSLQSVPSLGNVPKSIILSGVLGLLAIVPAGYAVCRNKAKVW